MEIKFHVTTAVKINWQKSRGCEVAMQVKTYHVLAEMVVGLLKLFCLFVERALPYYPLIVESVVFVAAFEFVVKIAAAVEDIAAVFVMQFADKAGVIFATHFASVLAVAADVAIIVVLVDVVFLQEIAPTYYYYYRAALSHSTKFCTFSKFFKKIFQIKLGKKTEFSILSFFEA